MSIKALEAAEDAPTATVCVAPGLNVVGAFIFFPYVKEGAKAPPNY